MSWRDGKAEVERATAILNQELPADLLPSVLPLKSPGQGTLVNVLFERGVRGADLNPWPLEQHWAVLAGGSSSFAVDNKLICADEESSFLHLETLIPECFKKCNERPGGADFPSEPCIKMRKRSFSTHYFGAKVTLSKQQFSLVSYLVTCGLKSDRWVPEVDIFKHLGQRPNVTVVMSHIRGAFKTATAELSAELQFAAETLVDEIFPAKQQRIGFRLGRPNFFTILDE